MNCPSFCYSLNKIDSLKTILKRIRAILISSEKYIAGQLISVGSYIKYILLALGLTGSSFSFSQKANLDSLWFVYSNKTNADTLRLKAINDLAWEYIGNNPDSAILFAEKELDLAKKTDHKKFEAKASLHIGNSYQNKGDFIKALEHFLSALKIAEEIKDKKVIGASYLCIGNIYYYQFNLGKALEYYQKALQIKEETSDKKGVGSCYTNIAIIYQLKNDFKTALHYYFKSLQIKEELNDLPGKGICYANIATAFQSQNEYATAKEYHLKSLKIRREIDDKSGMVGCYNNLGELQQRLLNFKLALQYNDSGLRLAKEIGDLYQECLAYQNLADIFFKTGKYKPAYEYHVKFKLLADSIFNQENSKQLGDLKTKFEVERKETELKIKAEALQAVTNEEEKKQRIIIYSVIGVLLIVLIFSFFLFKRFQVTKRQKNIIENQKVLVDIAYEKLHEKNKEVLDSIYYARRIQRALLTSEKYIAKYLNIHNKK